MLMLTFWVAAICAITSIINRAETYEQISQFLVAVIGILTMAFLFFAIYSACFGSKDMRPFWFGTTIVCGYLVFLEPSFQMGFQAIFEMIAQYVAKDDGLQHVRANVIRGIVQDGCTPLMGIAGGVLAASIERETQMALSSKSDEESRD